MKLQLRYVMVNVSDMTQSLEFYRDKLGLTSRFESEWWSEFDTGATTLALHHGVKRDSASNSATEKEPVAGTSFIGFDVESVDEVYEALSAKGVTFLSEPETKEQEGIRSTNCLDPDGLTVTISQSLH